jgi:SAM-dependent methyltransferase
MPPAGPFDSWSRRLAVYGYLAPLLDGRRVLELGCGHGAGAARLRALGAAWVLGVDGDTGALARARQAERVAGLQFAPFDRRSLESAGAFDLIVVPQGDLLLRAGAPFGLGALRSLLGPGGRIALIAPSADRSDASAGTGVGYYTLVEALERLFPKVRMFGLTPFAAYGAAEFSAETVGLRIEGGLVDDGSDQPTHYLAVAGPDEGFQLGYALLQVPVQGAGPAEPAAPVPAPEPQPQLQEQVQVRELQSLRQRAADAEGKAEGVLRVSRAQAEEIQELQARLRRGAESRNDLDQEVARLRKALAEADASVLDLTRRTREEVSALTRQIGGGLRADAEQTAETNAAVARLREDLRRRSEELAARQAMLKDRDARIAALEAENHDLQRRLQAAGSAQAANGAATEDDEARAEDQQRRQQAQQAIDQYRLAATAHLEEVNRLREALAEQSTLVSELEDALAGTGRRLQSNEGELERLRRHVAEVEQADRVRRSRLAEVEGTLLRLKSQAAAAPAPALPPPPATNAKLEAALAEASHLREALDRTEEQLWETKGQMLLDQERLAAVEEQLASQAAARGVATPAPADGAVPTVTEAAHRSILEAVLAELAEMESGMRLEIGKLDSIERFLETWRSDLTVAERELEVPLTRAD